MKSALRSIEWILGSSAALFYSFGRFIAPHYEQMLTAADPETPVTPFSKYCVWFAYFLLLMLVMRVGYRWKKR